VCYSINTDRAYEKGTQLLEAGCAFSEYGTRRRRSFHAHDLVVGQLVHAAEDHPGSGKLLGTSNVGFTSGARRSQLIPFCRCTLHESTA
jgi:nicotinate phosphoribosyltransferase